eukprot:Hpha_TRINITY_DN16779_c5_g1::TRINITY_DN16779_c5_g1_i1::g.79335::m.79335
MMNPFAVQFCVYSPPMSAVGWQPAAPAVATCPSYGMEIMTRAQLATTQQQAPATQPPMMMVVPALVPPSVPPSVDLQPVECPHTAKDPKDDQQKNGLRALPGLRMLMLVGVSPAASVPRLERAVENTLDAKVLRSQPLWNRGGLLLVMDRDVFLRSRRLAIGLPGVHLLGSCKETISPKAQSPILNVRFFVLDPNLDFSGSAKDEAVHKRAVAVWGRTEGDDGFSDDLLLGQHLETEAGESWIKMARPIQPRRKTEVSGRQARLYTQLYFAFAEASIASRVSETTDGTTIHALGLRLVIRSEYAKPWAMDKAPQVVNPRLSRSHVR